MKLGDFFAAAPYARPVNPCPVSFTATHSGKILPDGSANPTGRTVAATVTGAFALVVGEDYQKARVDAHQAVQARKGLADDQEAFFLELCYQMLWRAVREWDEKTCVLGGALFPSADVLKQMVVPAEAARLMNSYNKYVADEHPEAVDPKTFRGAQSGS